MQHYKTTGRLLLLVLLMAHLIIGSCVPASPAEDSLVEKPKAEKPKAAPFSAFPRSISHPRVSRVLRIVNVVPGPYGSSPAVTVEFDDGSAGDYFLGARPRVNMRLMLIDALEGRSELGEVESWQINEHVQTWFDRASKPVYLAEIADSKIMEEGGGPLGAWIWSGAQVSDGLQGHLAKLGLVEEASFLPVSPEIGRLDTSWSMKDLVSYLQAKIPSKDSSGK